MVSGFSIEDLVKRIRVLSNKMEDEKYVALVEDYRKSRNNNTKVGKEVENNESIGLTK